MIVKKLSQEYFVLKKGHHQLLEGYYDEIQDLLKAMAGLDELLQGTYILSSLCKRTTLWLLTGTVN